MKGRSENCDTFQARGWWTVDALGTNAYTYTAGNQVLTEDGPFDSDTITNS